MWTQDEGLLSLDILEVCLTQKTNLSPFSFNLILFMLAAYLLLKVTVLTDYHKRKGDPDKDQRNVQNEEGLGR